MGGEGGDRRFLLIHGGLHGAWCWAGVLEALVARGVRAAAIDLPGHGERVAEIATPDSYADAVIAAAEPGDIVVGHSLGGLAITMAAARVPSLFSRRVYLAAFVPESGGILADNISLGDAGLSGITETTAEGRAYRLHDFSGARDLLYGDCDEAVARAAFARLTPQQFAPLTCPANFDEDAAGSAPATYVLCTQDRCLRPTLAERMAARLDVTPIRFAAAHAPFLSRPEKLAELLAAQTN